jgi:hypothetical protein
MNEIAQGGHLLHLSLTLDLMASAVANLAIAPLSPTFVEHGPGLDDVVLDHIDPSHGPARAVEPIAPYHPLG